MHTETLKKELIEIAQIVQQYPEAVQLEAFRMLTAHLAHGRALASNEQQPSGTPAEAVGDAHVEPQRRQTSKKVGSKESYKIDRDLNLRGDGNVPSFKAFAAEKKPGSAKEFNAVAVYYLKKLVGLEVVTLNHAYTCYSEVKLRPPQHFKQSFTDTKNKEGWIEFDAAGNLEIPHRGVVFVEHDLPRPARAAAGSAE